MLTQTSEYALRAAICLAREDWQLVATNMLAQSCGVPSNYLAKVLQKLSASDLVAGRRGVGGGYRLARDPEEIRLIDVVTAVEPLRRSGGGRRNEAAELRRLGCILDVAARRSVTILSQITIAHILDGSELDGVLESSTQDENIPRR